MRFTVTRLCGGKALMAASKDVLDLNMEKAEKVIPPSTSPHSYSGGSLELARVWNAVGRKKEACDIAYPVATQAAEYLEWYLNLPGKMLLLSEKDCMYYIYQMHAAVGILESAGSEKTLELAKKLDLYNQMLQTRLYGSVGMNDADESSDYEEDEEDTL